MKNYGTLLIALGAMLILVAMLLVPTTVVVDGYGALSGTSALSDRVSNLHGMHIQGLVVQSGLACILGGIVLFGFGATVEALEVRTMPVESGVNRLVKPNEADSTMPASVIGEEEAEEPDTLLDDEYLASFSINRVGDQYEYAGFRYDRAEDALAYAHLQKRRAQDQ